MGWGWDGMERDGDGMGMGSDSSLIYADFNTYGKEVLFIHMGLIAYGLWKFAGAGLHIYKKLPGTCTCCTSNSACHPL